MTTKAERVATERAAVLSTAVAEAAKRLELGPTAVGKIVGVSQSTASRLLHGDYTIKHEAKEWELSAHLVRLYRSLFSLVGGDDELARGWLRSRNKAFDEQQPIDLIKRVDGLLQVCGYLDAHRARL